MAAPALLNVYPADEDTGIPVGAAIVLDFDRGIDVTKVEDFVILYGADSDQTSGPDSALWIDADTGDNPYFLQSPGYRAPVDLTARVVYYDLDTGEDVATPELTSEVDEAAEGAAGVGHRVYLTPTAGQLAADTEYTLYIWGDPDSQSTGIRSRTVFDVVPDAGNSSSTGTVHCTGGYTGSTPDAITIEITTAGDIGAAKYKWWFNSAGVGEAQHDKLTNRRYRALGQGVQVRFSGSDFALGDTFTVNLEPPEYMAASTQVVFTTNDGTYTEPPDSPSTPAPSTPPASTIPPAPGESTEGDYLQVLEMEPADGAYNVSVNTRTITLLFSGDLDDATVTQDTVRIWRVPAAGVFDGQAEPIELQKRLTVSGNQLTIEI